MKIASTKSEILKISTTQKIHTLMTNLSTVIQATEGLQNDLATTEANRAKREAKAVKFRIPRKKDEKRDRVEQEEKREEIRKTDKEEAETNQRKD